MLLLGSEVTTWISGPVEEMRGNLIGTWGVQSWDLAQEPRQDHQPTNNKCLLAVRQVRRRSRRLDPQKNTRRRRRTNSGVSAWSWILPCWRLGGPSSIAQVGCLDQRPFWCSAGSCSERPPSRQFRESFASAAFWVSGVLLPELGPWHGYYLGRRSPLGFPDLAPLRCEAPGWGGDARKSPRYLRGFRVGTWHRNPDRTTNPRKTKACWQRGRCAGEAGASIPKRTPAGGGGQS